MIELFLRALDSFSSFSIRVSLDPKSSEKVEKQDSVKRDDHLERARIRAIRKADHDVGHVADNDDELGHLEGSEVFLPPEEFSILRPERAQSVVKVHDEMHERVDPCVEGAKSSWRDLDSPPPRVRHQSVVNDVESRDLVPFLFQDEKIRIEELHVL